MEGAVDARMPTTPIPELEPKRKPEPEIKQPTTPPKPEVGEDQGDSGPDRDNPITARSKRPVVVDREDGHIGATEGQVSDTTAPSGDAFDDEPRQG